MFIREVDLGSQFIRYKLVISHIHTYMAHRGQFCTSQSFEHTWPPPTCQPHSCPDQMPKSPHEILLHSLGVSQLLLKAIALKLSVLLKPEVLIRVGLSSR